MFDRIPCQFSKLSERAPASSFNAFGAEGWEMVSFDTVPLTGRFSENITSFAYLTFFKRPARSGFPAY